MIMSKETINVEKEKVHLYETNGQIRTSSPGGGCGSPGCPCSPGHWISVIKPMTEDYKINITKFRFDTRKELEEFMNIRG